MSKKNDRNMKKKETFLQKAGKVAKDLATTAGRTAVSEFARWGIRTLLGANDPEWYTHYPVDGLVGANYAIKRGEPIVGTPLASVARIKIDLVKPIGIGKEAWEQGIAYLYATLRAANTSNVAYSSYDLEKYIFNVRALRFAYAHIRRAYSICRTISAQDVSTPDIYMAAAYVDPSYLADLANVKQYGNMLSIKLARLAPIVGDIFKRTDWLLSYGYYDSNTAKAVPFIFAANSIKYLHFSTEDNEWEVKTISLNASFNDVVNDLNNALDSFTSNEKFSLIAGDIIRTFGQESLSPLEIWDDNMEFTFVYNEEVLRQINNIKFPLVTGISTNFSLSAPDSDWMDCSIKMDTSELYPLADKVVTQLNAIYDNILINAKYVTGPTAADILVDTRLTAAFEIIKDPAQLMLTTSVVQCGTELASEVRIYYRDSNGNITSRDVTYMSIASPANLTKLKEVSETISLWSQVDWMPQMSVYLFTIGSDFLVNGFEAGSSVWDIDKYAVIHPRDLGVYNSYAVLSLLHANLKARVTNAVDMSIMK